MDRILDSWQGKNNLIATIIDFAKVRQESPASTFLFGEKNGGGIWAFAMAN